MLNDLSDAVLSCALPIEVTRWMPALVTKGRKQGKPISEKFIIDASVQPMGPKELRRLPEGSRTDGAVSVYAIQPLHTVETSEGKLADHFRYNGVNYQIKSIEDWFDLGGYYLMGAERVDR